MAGQGWTINENDLAVDRTHELPGILGEIGGGDEDALPRAAPLQRACKPLYFRPADPGFPPLCLDVDDIQTEPILLDYSVDSAITASSDGLTGIPKTAAIPHLDNQPVRHTKGARMSFSCGCARV